MLLILLAWQMMRFDEAVESRGTKAAAKASTEKDEQKASEQRAQEERQAFAAAFQAQGNQHLSRQAYNEGMQITYDLEIMQLLGFSEAKPRVRSAQWSDEEVAAMLQCWPAAGKPYIPVIPSTSSHTTACCVRRALRKYGLFRDSLRSVIALREAPRKTVERKVSIMF